MNDVVDGLRATAPFIEFITKAIGLPF